jgi:hypothetical protein
MGARCGSAAACAGHERVALVLAGTFGVCPSSRRGAVGGHRRETRHAASVDDACGAEFKYRRLAAWTPSRHEDTQAITEADGSASLTTCGHTTRASPTCLGPESLHEWRSPTSGCRLAGALGACLSGAASQPRSCRRRGSERPVRVARVCLCDDDVRSPRSDDVLPAWGGRRPRARQGGRRSRLRTDPGGRLRDAAQ